MNGTLTLPLSQMLLRLGVATLLGVIVGFERERLERAAGLRTHALVALASALIMLVSAYSFADLPATPRDPTRMAAQVVSGIGFLGAGVIIFRKNTVRGLTTAASVWAAAGLGLAAGGGMLLVATVATAFILLIQVGLRPLEQRFFTHHRANLAATPPTHICTQRWQRIWRVRRVFPAPLLEWHRHGRSFSCHP